MNLSREELDDLHNRQRLRTCEIAAFNEQLSILCPRLYLSIPKGSPIKNKNGKICYSNGDCWRLVVNRKASLDRLCELLKPYLKHADWRAAMLKAWANVKARGV